MTTALALFNPFQWMVVISLWCFVGLLVTAFTRVCAAVQLISAMHPVRGAAALVVFIVLWPLAFMFIWIWLGYQDWQNEKRASFKTKLEKG